MRFPKFANEWIKYSHSTFYGVICLLPPQGFRPDGESRGGILVARVYMLPVKLVFTLILIKPRGILYFLCLLALEDKGNSESTHIKKLQPEIKFDL